MANREKLVLLRKTLTPFGECRFEVSTDAMEAYFSCARPSPGMTDDDLKSILCDAEISHGIQDDAIAQIVAIAETGQPVERILVARGTPVTEGRNGHLKFHKQPVGGTDGAEDDDETKDAAEQAEKTRIDYREMNRFDNVKSGDLIATYIPAVPGSGGTDVLGRVIPAPKVQDLTVRIGENIRHDETENAYYATHHGLVTFRRSMIAVTDVYDIAKDLTLKHGNIRFVGAVKVGGDIGDGYQVTAAEGITVGGTIEASNIVSGRDIIIQGGVTGKEKGQVRAKGTIRARYLSEADVITQGDVIVEREIVNSRVYALGRVVVESGTIMGSEVVALGGLITGDAGSDLGVHTTLVAGLHYKVWQQIRELDLELVNLREEQQKSLRFLHATFDKADAGEAIEGWLRDKVARRMEEAETKQKTIRRLERQVGDLSEEFADQAVSCISVAGTVYPGVALVAGRTEREITSPLTGPLSVFPDRFHSRTELESGLLVKKIWSGHQTTESLTESSDESDEAPDRCDLPGEERHLTYEEVEARFRAFDPERANRKGGRVLVAEDQTNMRMLICKALSKSGYETIEAKTGTEALIALQNGNIDCAVLDITMPDKSGIDVIRALRANGGPGSNTPFVICSGRKDKKDILAAMSLGASGYIVKPFQMNDLLEKVDGAIASSSDTDHEEDESPLSHSENDDNHAQAS